MVKIRNFCKFTRTEWIPFPDGFKFRKGYVFEICSVENGIVTMLGPIGSVKKHTYCKLCITYKQLLENFSILD